MSTPDKGSSSRLTQLIASAPRPDELKRLSNEDPVPYQKLAIGAAQRGHVQLLAYCLDAGGAVVDNDVEIAAWKGASPELYAVMMDHGWPARPNALSMTQVLATNYVKGPSMIEFLVGRGAVVTRDLVISIASHSRGDVASLEVLARHNTNFEGTGTLQIAATHNDVAVADYLLQQGVDIDEVPAEDTWDPRQCQNGTPLCRALEMKNVKIARFLLRKGASREIRNQMGFTADDIAKRMGIVGWSDGIT